MKNVVKVVLYQTLVCKASEEGGGFLLTKR